MPNVKKIKELRHSVLFSLAPLPAVRLLCITISGILAGVNLSFTVEVWLLCCVIALVTLLAGILYEKLTAPAPFPHFFSAIGYAFFVFFCFAAYSDYQLHYVPRDGLLRFSGKKVLLYGRVDDRPKFSKTGVGWIMEVEDVFESGRSVKLRDRAKVFMRSAGRPDVRIGYGDMVWVKGQLDLIPEAANRGEFDPRNAGRMKQLSVQLYCAGPWQVQHEGKPRLNGFERFIVQPVHEFIMKSLEELLPDGEERKLSAGVLTGEKESMSEEVFEAFKLTGTAHILAVSGLNVGLLAFVIHICLQRFKVTMPGRWASFLLFAFILLVYCNVTGNSPSVKRAAVMSLVLIGGKTLGRKTYPVNSLALADFLILLFDPFDLLNPGFLMTNGAVLAILLIYPRCISSKQKDDSLLRSSYHLFLSSVMVTIAAIIGVAPIIAYYFGTFSVISILANIPVVLCSTLLMYSLVPMLLLNLVSGYAASFFAASSFFFAKLTLHSALYFSKYPFASITIRPDATEVCLYYLILAGLLYFIYQKQWEKVAVFFLFGANVLFWYLFFLHPRPVAPNMVTVNLGRNLSALFSSGSETVLIDAGRSMSDRKRIAQQIDEYGLTSPDAVVQFYTPDSLIVKVPASHHMLQDSTVLALSSIVIVRLEEKVLKLWSRKGSLLIVSGISRLKEEEIYKADIAIVWVYRFGQKQRQEITSWLTYVRPRRCILVPGSFLSRSHLAAMHNFVASYSGLETRSKTRQIVVY
ncbi:MAG: ComEC family competence protein [Chlorobiaceae bacterium]|nr:ComEC family competence protein [Chlorobiaceae bacterium]NTV16590.1 ComEC family competence protein [Chlorobiaceae bacterium]